MKKLFLSFFFLLLFNVSFGQIAPFGVANNTAVPITVMVGAGPDCLDGLTTTVTMPAFSWIKVDPLGPETWDWTGVQVLTGGSGSYPSPCVCDGTPSFIGITGTWSPCGPSQSITFTP